MPMPDRKRLSIPVVVRAQVLSVNLAFFVNRARVGDIREPRNLFSRFHVPIRYDVVVLLSAEASD